MTSASGAGAAAGMAKTADGKFELTAQPQILRTLVHELRQPLGSIEATAYYLDLVLPHGDQRSRGHVARLHDFVGQCSWMLACGLELANERPLHPVLLDLEATITQVVSARAIPGQPVPELNLTGGLPLVMGDPARARTLVENLLSLFERVASDRHRVVVHSVAEKGSVQLEMDVAVPGFKTENSLGPGTQLGLDSLRRGAALQGATLAFAVDPIGGVYARLSWPEVAASA